MKIYAIRHGETDWNKQRITQGLTDIELNETGINQAKGARDTVRNLGINLIVASTLKRARETAEIISDDKIDIIFDSRIIERNFGDLEGNKMADIHFDDLYKYDDNTTAYNVEPVQDLYFRVKSFLEEIKEKYIEKKVLIVTHGGALRAVNACANGISESRILESQNYKNCEIREFDI